MLTHDYTTGPNCVNRKTVDLERNVCLGNVPVGSSDGPDARCAHSRTPEALLRRAAHQIAFERAAQSRKQHATMSIDVLTSPRKRCPVCDAGKVKRAHRTREEKAKYPNSKSYRCRRCETRYIYVTKRDRTDEGSEVETRAATADGTGAEAGGLSELVHVAIFVLACVLAGLSIYLFGRS